MALGSILGEIGLSEQLVLSFIIGNAAAPAVRPYVQEIVNTAWASNPALPPPAVYIAQGVAQGQVDLKAGQGWANAEGFSDDVFAALVETANVGMPLGNAYQSWRRGDLTDAEFKTQLHRLGIESEWWPMLVALKTDRLNLGAIATAVHRGIMADDGLLVTPVPTGTGNVPRIPVSPLDTLAEFAALGIDPERARVLVADTGLPLSLGEMLTLYNRGEVTETDVKVSIAESNVRNEYMDVALSLARRLLTPHEYAEGELRGLITTAQAKAGAALSGITPADYDLMFGNLGRPLNIHQVTTGLARGGTFGGDYTSVPDGPYRDAIRRSAIRPEYASLDYANRYTYPSAFVLRSLAQAGTLGNAAAVQKVLEEIGWPPAFAKQVAEAWTGSTGGDSHIGKAQTQLWTTTHTSYKDSEIDDPTATAALQEAGVEAASIPGVLKLWQAERALIRKQLSPAQIVKAVKGGTVNPATGAPWTDADALAALTARGYDQADATTLLNE